MTCARWPPPAPRWRPVPTRWALGPRLCAGYAAEAIGDTASAPDPRTLLEGLAQAPVEEAPAVGLGREHRLAGKGVAGAALVVEETVAHLMAFPAAG